MKLPWSMLKPWGCVESGGLWNLLGFIETKPLIRGGGLGQCHETTHTHTHIYIFNYLFIYLFFILAEGLRFPGSRFRMLLSKYLHIPDGSDLHLGPNAIPHLMCPETRLFFTNPEIDMNLWMDLNQHKHWTHIIQSRKANKMQHQAIPKNNI